MYPHLSPSGHRVAVQEGGDIWVYDTERNTRTRITTSGGTDPVWTPDGRRVTFASNMAGTASIYWAPADGSGEIELLVDRGRPAFPHSWSPDGEVLAFYEVSPDSARDIWIFRTDQDVPEPFLVTPFNERSPTFSPGGRWMAFVSDETGRDEVYVVPFPGPGGKLPLSTNGGREPVWLANGQGIVYRRGEDMMAVVIRTSPMLSADRPTVLFASAAYDMLTGPSGSQGYDVTHDGTKFVMTRGLQELAPTQLNIVLNWFEELRAKVGN